MKTLFIALIILTGCATRYQPSAWDGGYSEQQLASDIYKVSFSGNGHTSTSTASSYVLRRSAEVTLEKGYSHFRVISANSDISYSTYKAYNQINLVEKPSVESIIQLYKDNVPSGAFDAAIILAPFRTPANK